MQAIWWNREHAFLFKGFIMAFITANARPGTFRRIGAGLLDALWTLFNAGPMLAEVERLTRLSDADLAARGTTRAAEVQRIFGPRAHF